MSTNTKYMIIAGVAILVVIALAMGLSRSKTDDAMVPATDTTVVEGTADTDVKTADKATDGGKSAWDAKLAEYKGRLIVFGADCSATPTDHVQAMGSTVLLVNNSNVDHTIAVGGGAGVKVAAMHYKTAKIMNGATQVVSCDDKESAATITVK